MAESDSSSSSPSGSPDLGELEMPGSPRRTLKEGFLQKRQRGLKQRSKSNLRFQRRFVRLTFTYLQYYSDAKAKDLKGVFPISNIQVVETVPPETFRRNFCFQVGNKEEYMYLCASSEKEMQEWMQSLRSAAFTVQGNTPLTHYHFGAFGLKKRNVWSCCNQYGMDIDGCVAVATRDRIASLPVTAMSTLSSVKDPTQSVPVNLPRALTSFQGRLSPVKDISPIRENPSDSPRCQSDEPFSNYSCAPVDVLKRHYSALQEQLLKAGDITALVYRAFRRTLVTRHVFSELRTSKKHERVALLLESISSRISYDSASLDIFLEILERESSQDLLAVVNQMRKELSDPEPKIISISSSSDSLDAFVMVSDGLNGGQSATPPSRPPVVPPSYVPPPRSVSLSEWSSRVHSTPKTLPPPVSTKSHISLKPNNSFPLSTSLSDTRLSSRSTSEPTREPVRLRAPSLDYLPPMPSSPFGFRSASVTERPLKEHLEPKNSPPSTTGHMAVPSPRLFKRTISPSKSLPTPSDRLIDRSSPIPIREAVGKSTPALPQQVPPALPLSTLTNVPEEQLDQECKDKHLAQLALSGNFHWQEWAEHLCLTDQQIKDLKEDVVLVEREKGQKALEKWHDRFGFKATYRHLVELFLNEGNASLAEDVCEILRGAYDKLTHRSNQNDREVEIGIGEPTITECTKCNPLQAAFLVELRKQLKVFRGLNWSEDIKYTAIEQAVGEYVEKFIKAGGSDICHLLEHVHSLHEDEKLISNPTILEAAKQLALKLHAPPSIPVPVSMVTQLSSPVRKKRSVSLSKLDVYRASICCLTFGRCPPDDCRNFFKSQQHLSFSQVSISGSQQGRYLVAVGEGSTYYVAFESQPNVRGWPGRYKSFDEGITLQAKAFPLHFLFELLNKNKRLVLTGFSLGGSVACSVAARIWTCGYFTAQQLQESLTCITFAQPHFRYPQLSDVTKAHPEITTTLHAVYSETDICPRLMQYLDMPCGTMLKKGIRRKQLPLPFEDGLTLRLLDEIGTMLHHPLETTTNETPLLAACSVGDTQTAQQLVSRGEDVDKCDQHGTTPLMAACKGGHSETALMLIHHGADLNRRDQNGTTSLMAACKGGHSETALMLIHRGADPNRRDQVGATALHLASQFGHTATVDLLVQAGALLEMETKEGATALQLASQNRHDSTSKLLIEAGASTETNSKKRKPLTPSYEFEQVLSSLSGVSPIEHRPVSTYHLLTSQDSSTLVLRQIPPKETSGETLLPTLKEFLDVFTPSEHSMDAYVGKVSQACWRDSPAPVSRLSPTVIKMEVHYYGSECALVLEGANLHFCDKISINRSEVPAHALLVSGSSVQANVEVGLPFLENKGSVDVEIHNPFVTHTERDVPVSTKAVQMSVRQQQLAKLTPSQVIELSYLSALLERQPDHSQQPFSSKVDAIRRFLEKIVQIVPIESIGYAIAYGDSYVAKQCEEAVAASGLSLSSLLMADAQRASYNRQSHHLASPVQNATPSSVISDLSLESLYPITGSSQGIRSPIEILRAGRDQLSYLHTSSGKSRYSSDNSQQAVPMPPNAYPFLSSQEFSPGNLNMLRTVNQIKQTDLALCISLIVGFINQEKLDIPLPKSDLDHISRGGPIVSTSALSGLGRNEVCSLMDESRSGHLFVRVEGMHHVTDTSDQNYAGKLYFIVQSLQQTVTYSRQFTSYSLERQLALLSQERQLTDSVSLNSLVEKWDKWFCMDTLSLVDKSHRPLIARWLKWALMVHNLREELAKYTAVGVVGLVNSGKSRLVNALFRIKTASGTTEEKRTTIPFIYNVSDKVEGLDVVDFPGVDDRDESISDLATLLLTLAQIIIFVVDYRKIHTESSEKWLKRLQDEKVPVLVCLTYADKLYAEHMKTGQHPDESFMKDRLDSELRSIRDVLGAPKDQVIHFCSFQQDQDSTLNSDQGRQKLRNVGIDSPLDVGDWLVETFRLKFGQRELADKVRDFIHDQVFL